MLCSLAQTFLAMLNDFHSSFILFWILVIIWILQEVFQYFSKYFQNFCRDEELHMVNFSFQCVPETEKFDSFSCVPNTISVRVFRVLEILFSRIICVLYFFSVEWSWNQNHVSCWKLTIFCTSSVSLLVDFSRGVFNVQTAPYPIWCCNIARFGIHLCQDWLAKYAWTSLYSLGEKW